MKQTAVQIFWNKIALKLSVEQINEFLLEFEQAKAMEKEQVIKSNRDGVDMCVDKKYFTTGEQYYNQTYQTNQDKPNN
jgi:hypothetical protein